MERRDLLSANAEIFRAQGRALNETAKRDAKVVVVGNPANTNAMILAANAPDFPNENVTSMIRLDHNRALTQLATKAGVAHLAEGLRNELHGTELGKREVLTSIAPRS